MRAAKRDALSSESVRRGRTRTEDCSVQCTMTLARVAIVTLLLNGAAFAQTPGMGETRPAPPPAVGDTTENTMPALPGASEKSRSESDPAINRCNDLTGAAREDCVRKEHAASAGATRRPEPPSAPPPQNPR
jgi:hypothetical protein